MSLSTKKPLGVVAAVPAAARVPGGVAPADDVQMKPPVMASPVDHFQADAPAMAGGANATFGSLARDRVGAAFDAVVEGRRVLTDTMLPDDEGLRPFRKTLKALRDMLDLFAYCYPSGSTDGWAELRRHIDEGYEKVGALKDLYDSQPKSERGKYNEKELKAVRAAVVDWAASFDAQREAFEATAKRPSDTETFPRSQNELSPFYWQLIDARPLAGARGTAVIRGLVDRMLETSSHLMSDAAKFKKLDSKKEEEAVHDARKQVRHARDLLAYFPELGAGEGFANIVEAVSETVTRYGEVGDLLVRRERRDKAEPKLDRKIDERWRALRKDTDEHLVQVQALRDALVFV